MTPIDTTDEVTARDETVDVLNALLRGEMSAVEAYDKALGKFADDPTAAGVLAAVRDEHREAVAVIRDHVTEDFAGEPAEGSGAWGGFVAAVTGTAKVLGPGTVLATLKQGEEFGVLEYRRALEAGVPPVCRDFILRLIPLCEEHIARLDDLIASPA